MDEINKQIAELTDALNQSKAATTPLEDQVESIKGRIAYIENDVITKEKNINKGYADLEKQTDKFRVRLPHPEMNISNGWRALFLWCDIFQRTTFR